MSFFGCLIFYYTLINDNHKLKKISYKNIRPHKYFSFSKNKERKNSKFIQLLMSYIFFLRMIIKMAAKNIYSFYCIQNRIE